MLPDKDTHFHLVYCFKALLTSYPPERPHNSLVFWAVNLWIEQNEILAMFIIQTYIIKMDEVVEDCISNPQSF